MDAGQEEILTPGTEYKIQSVNPDGSLIVVDRDGKGDTVFDDEVEVVASKKPTRKATAKSTDTTASKGGKTKTPAKKTAPKKTTTKKPKKTKAVETVEPVDDAAEKIAAAVQQLTDSKSVAAILESKDMLTAAKELAVAAEETFLSLGGVLSHISETGAHKMLGFDGKRGFADYMLKELNINYRKGPFRD